MTTPTYTNLSELQSQYLEPTINPYITSAQAAVNTPAPGAVQSGIDFDALVTALGYYVQLAADVGNVFAQTFESTITENLLIAQLVTAVIADIESAVAIGVGFIPTSSVVAAGAAAPAATDTVSSVLAQVQQQATANLTLANTVFTDAKTGQPDSNFPAGLEAQVLGGLILFQQDINAVLNSFPASVSDANESNPVLLPTLQNLLLVEQNLSTILSEIDSNDNYEQPISLTGNNVGLILAGSASLSDTAIAAVLYAAFALEALSGDLVTVSAPGAYTVNVPSGATYVDMVLIGGGAGGGGYDTAGSGTGGAGGATTATPAGGSTLTAAGGLGGANNTVAASAGVSPGNESFDGQTYDGGTGGAVGSNSAGGNGTAPGGGGGGGGAFGSYGGAGGTAGAWAAETLAITSGMTTITGSVGAGGTAGASVSTEKGGTGGHGEAFFYFYS